MARVTASYSYADGDKVAITVEVGESFPDAVAEARAAAIEGLREAMVLGIVTQRDEGEE